MGWHFVEVERVHLLWAAIAVVVLLGVLELRARAALAAFLSPVMQGRLAARASTARIVARLALVLVSLACAIGALMRPQARGETETVAGADAAADIMFVLDVSRSMLAEDAAPNRLARAKDEIAQLVSRLDGHRVGLVVFAGRAAPACPLTPDRAFFTTVLGSVDTRSAGRGGTRVGDALKVAVRGFPAGRGAKLIVLITDGDDQDPYTQEAAQAARDAGIKIVAIGLGSEKGSTITLTDPQTGAKTTLTEDGKPGGKPVISKLDGDALRKIALVTEGAYIPAGTSAVDLDAIVESHVRPIMREGADKILRVIPAERYLWFVIGALASLFAALWVGATATTERRRS